MPGLDVAKLIASVAGAVVRPNPLAMSTIEGTTCSQYELEAETVAATRNPTAVGSWAEQGRDRRLPADDRGRRYHSEPAVGEIPGRAIRGHRGHRDHAPTIGRRQERA